MLIRNFLQDRVCVKTGDITAETTDAIVNAANKTLMGGGGVDGAIHRAGGPDIVRECKTIRAERFPEGLPTGEAVITSGGRMNASFVIHTVGPIYGGEGGHERELLARCYKNCIALAESYKLASVSFPSISTGAFGFPKPLAAETASRAVLSVIDDLHSIKQVNFVFFSEEDALVFIRHSIFA